MTEHTLIVELQPQDVNGFISFVQQASTGLEGSPTIRPIQDISPEISSSTLRSEIETSTVILSVTSAAIVTIGSIIKEWIRSRRTKLRITNPQTNYSLEIDAPLSPKMEETLGALFSTTEVDDPLAKTAKKGAADSKEP